MRYRVTVPAPDLRHVMEEDVEAFLVEIGGNGALLFWDEAHYLTRAFASGRWVTLTMLDGPEISPTGDMHVPGGMSGRY